MMPRIANTFVVLAGDCPVAVGTVPPPRGAVPTIASLQHDLR